MSPRDWSALSIEEVLRLMREGEDGAVEELLRRYQKQMSASAKQRVGDFAPGGIRTSDVTQEAAVRALKYLPRFRGESEGELSKYLRDIDSPDVAIALRLISYLSLTISEHDQVPPPVDPPPYNPDGSR